MSITDLAGRIPACLLAECPLVDSLVDRAGLLADSPVAVLQISTNCSMICFATSMRR